MNDTVKTLATATLEVMARTLAYHIPQYEEQGNDDLRVNAIEQLEAIQGELTLRGRALDVARQAFLNATLGVDGWEMSDETIAAVRAAYGVVIQIYRS